MTGASQTLVDNVIAAIRAKNLDGVNVDFEGIESPVWPDLQFGITRIMTMLSTQIHAVMPQAEVSIDTYAGSASWDQGIFKIGDLAPVVDAMFIMAYDSVFSNMPGQAGPDAPMTGWTYNDTLDVAQYLTKAPASKIILGVPYEGYRWSTADNSLYSTAVSGAQSITYWGAQADSTCGGINFRMGWDPQGESPWASWWSPSSGDPCGDNIGKWQEIYFDDATSLGLKYDLVNSSNLRGAGMWALGMDTGYQDLWNELTTKFTTTTPWYPLGGYLTSGPDVSSMDANRVDAFVRGTDNGLWQITRTGGTWGPWAALGGYITTDPGAVSWGSGRIDVFAEGADHQLWHKFWDVSVNRWSGWEPLGGYLTSGAEAASWGSGRLDVFVRGTDNGLWHKYWDISNGRWSGWEALGGVLTSDPTAISWGPNRVDVFVRGTDNGLWQRSWDPSGWHAWTPLSGILVSSPDVSSCAPGHLDVFATGTDSSLYQIHFNGTTWGTWQRLGGAWGSDAGAVCPAGSNMVTLVERGPDHQLWQSLLPGS